MAEPKKVKVFDGTDWVDLKADDPNLPIYDSTEPAKVDGTDYGATVELSAPDDFKFAISTRDPTNVLDLSFVERMKVLNTGAFFSVDVSTDQVNTNAVNVKDEEDLTIYGFQNDGSKKQVLLKSRDGVSGTDSYEPTDNDSLVPKSYVDTAVSGVNVNLPIGDEDDTVLINSPQNYQIDIQTKYSEGQPYRSRISAKPDTVYIPNSPNTISALPTRANAKYNPPNVDYDPDTNLATPLGLQQGDDAFNADVAAATTGVMRFYQDSSILDPNGDTEGARRDGNFVGVGLTSQTLHVGTNDNVIYLKLRAGGTETASFHSPLGAGGSNAFYSNAWDTLSDPAYPHPERLVVSNMAGGANTDLRSKYGRCTLYSGAVDSSPGLQVYQKSVGIGYAALTHYGILCGTKPSGSQDLHGIMAYNSFGPDQYLDGKDNINNVFMFRAYPRFDPNTKITRYYAFNTYPITPNNQFTYDADGKPVETEVPEISSQAYGFAISNNSLGGSASNYQVYLGSEATTWSAPNKDSEGKNDGTYTVVPRYPYATLYGVYQADARATNYFLGQVCSAGLSSYNNNEQAGDFPKYGWHDDPIPAADQIPPAPDGSPDIPPNPYSDAGNELRFQGSSILLQTYGQGLEVYAYGADYSGGSALNLGSNSVTLMRRNRVHYIEDGVSKFRMEYGGSVGMSGDTVNFGVPAAAGNWNWRVNESEHFEARVSSSKIICQQFEGVTEDGTKLDLNRLAELTNKDGSAYVAGTPNSLMTKKNVEDILTGSGGNDGGQLPGSGSNFIWQKVQIFEEYKVDGVTQPHQTYKSLVACDGIFTDGLHWSTDGENWRTIDSSLNSGIWSAQPDAGDRVVKSYDENLYFYESHFSYDMKNWNRINTTVYSPFYFDGHVLSNNGQSYFDPTINTMRSTADLYGKQPDIPDGMTTTYQLWGPAAGEKEGRTAFTIARHNNSGIDQLLMLRKDQTGNADWGWEVVALPGGEAPLQVLCTEGDNPRFWVFTGQKVYVSSVLTPTTFQPHDLPVNALWDLACHDGISFTIVSTTGDVSAFSSDGFTWHLSNNFQNINDSKIRLAGTNGRTIYGLDYGISDPVTDPDTNSVISYWVTEYLRSGVGTVGDETLIIGGGSLAQTGSIYLAEPIDTAQNNQASGFPTWRTAPPDYNLAPEPAVLRTQEQTNSYFNNKISITRHDQNALKEAVSDNTDEIAKRAVVVTLTQAEYEALSPPDENTLYLIT